MMNNDPLQFTTVAQLLNQGALPQSAVIGCGGPFWLLFGQAKSDKEIFVQRTNHLQKSK